MSDRSAAGQSLESEFAECDDRERCLWKVLMVACPRLNVQAGTMFEVDESGKALRVLHTWGILPWRVAQGKFPFEQGICGWVAQRREPAVVNEVRKDPRFNKQIDVVTQFETSSVLCVPFLAGGELIGVVELINRPEQPFSEADLAELQSILSAALARIQNLRS